MTDPELEEAEAVWMQGIEPCFTETTDYRLVMHAWLSPEGTFYAVPYHHHHGLAEAHGLKVNHRTWQHLSVGRWDEAPVTQAQYDVIFDWCRINGEEMPNLEIQ